MLSLEEVLAEPGERTAWLTDARSTLVPVRGGTSPRYTDC